MATFSQLMSAHRRSGKGYASSATTAAIQASLSAIDPRQVFNQQGVITALLPFLKPYSPRGPRGEDSSGMALRNEMRGLRNDMRNVANEIKLATNELKNVTKISSITATNTQIMAKNTIGIPMMTRDINLMRQNIQKLVKIQGGTPSTRADKDWLKAKEREAAYEVQFGRNSQTGTMPSQQSSVDGTSATKSSGGGFFSSLLSLVGGKFLIAGLVTALTSYFTNPEFKASVDKMIKTFGEFMFGKEGWQDLKENIGRSVEELLTETKNFFIDLAKENWQAIAAGLALYYGPSLLNLAASLTNLAVLIKGSGTATGILGAFRLLLGALTGPVGLIAAVGLAAYGIKNWMDSKDEQDAISKSASSGNLKDVRDIVTGQMGLNEIGYSDYTQEQVKEVNSKVRSYLEMKSKEGGTTGAWAGELLKKLNYKSTMDKFGFEELSETYPNRIPSGNESKKLLELLKEKDLLTEKFNVARNAKKDTTTIASKLQKLNEQIRMERISPSKSSQQDIKKTNVTKSSEQQFALDYLISKGWSPMQASAIVGNLMQESRLNPSAYNERENAWGIAQWRNSRLTDFENVMGIPVQNASLEQQLDFVDWELRNTEKSAGDKLKSAKSLSDAVKIVDSKYERSSGEHVSERLSFAESAMSLAKNLVPENSQLSGQPIVMDNSQTINNNYNSQSGGMDGIVASAFDMDFLNMLVDVAGNAQK